MEGTVLAGRYRLLSKLGQGGMGSVWRAEHLTLGTPLAIKLIDPSIAENAEALARFKREAQSAAELRSAHVVQIIDYGVDNQVPYIAMELLEGESLASRLERVRCLSPSHAAMIVSQVARALSRAHAAGIVHRDLKPENIYLVPEGDEDIAKVLDFGIAKKLSSLSSSSGVKTNTGALLGTPYYMSPEQGLGQSNIDHRTDIWSLGVITYQCIAGVRPFEKDTLGALLMAICNDPLPRPSAVAPVPHGFDDWFARAAARDVSLRFASAADAAAELRAICGQTSGRPSNAPGLSGVPAVSGSRAPEGTVLAGTPFDPGQTAVPSSVTIRGRKRARVRSLAVAVGGVAVLAVVGGVATLRGLGRRAPSVAASATTLVTQIATAQAAQAVEPAPAAQAERVSVPSTPSAGVAPQPATAIVVEPVSPGAAPSAPAPRANKNLQAVTRITKPMPDTKGHGAPANATAVAPLPSTVASAATKPKALNYEKSVGF
jgi:eukaryotic-like serine/threonine-protein kinase